MCWRRRRRGRCRRRRRRCPGRSASSRGGPPQSNPHVPWSGVEMPSNGASKTTHRLVRWAVPRPTGSPKAASTTHTSMTPVCSWCADSGWCSLVTWGDATCVGRFRARGARPEVGRWRSFGGSGRCRGADRGTGRGVPRRSPAHRGALRVRTQRRRARDLGRAGRTLAGGTRPGHLRPRRSEAASGHRAGVEPGWV